MKNEIRMENGIKDGVFYFANLLNLKDGKFVVPNGVKSLKEEVFATHSMLEEVVLPEGLEQIGYQAFKACKNLEKIKIPSTVTTIDAKAFSKCESLKQIMLPSGLSKVESYTFCGSGLEKITIPEGVTSIKDGAFEDCFYLENILLPNSLQEIGPHAFHDCGGLSAVSLKKNLKIIQPEAFAFCCALKNVELPYGLESIGKESFYHCNSIKKLNIPDSVEYIGPYAFQSCHSLEEIKLSERLTEIEVGIFKHCWELQEITIPNNVKLINNRAFEGCTALKQVNFGENLQIIEENAFRDCTNLVSLTMPKKLQQIKKSCFADCEALQTVRLNNNLRVIEDFAFVNCNSLRGINLPESILEIGENAFTNCQSLEKIILPQNLKILSRQVFKNCFSLKSVEFNEGLEEILNEAFADCDGLEYVKLPKSLKSIGQNTFSRCTNIKTVEMSSENIKSVGYGVFEDCESLEKIIIDGKAIKVTQDIIDNFCYVFDFLVYASKNNKFVPKNIKIMMLTNVNEIENFYTHSKDWKEILNSYLKEWQPVLVEGGKLELELAISNLYQISTALGLFAGGEDGIRAKNFLNNVILKMGPQTIHNLYGALDTKKNGYIKEYADFYIKNFYVKTVFGYGLHLLERVEFDNLSREDKIVNYTANAYNNWNKIKKAYPNRTVLAHRERGSENNNLTEEDIFNALKMTHYENVDEDNEEMAEIVGRYGYSQEEFEELQNWYNIAKKIKPNEVILNAGKDNETSGVTFELLEKSNAEALILGEEANCCQTVNDAGSSCVEYGVTKPNSGFVKFMFNDKIVGQSWVWYNEKKGVVCLDNIEVPTIWQKEMHKKQFQESFINCIKRLATSFKQEMEKNGHKVNEVAIGSGYNDLQGIDTFERKQTSKTVLPEDYNGYSDATNSWYVVQTTQKKIVFEDDKSR